MQLARNLAELVRGNPLRYNLGQAGQTAEDPRIRLSARHGFARSETLQVTEHEAAGVPDLRDERTRLLGTRAVDELAGLLVDVGIEADVLVVGDEREQVETHGVSAVLLDKIHGVDAVALGLGHAGAVLGQDGSVDDHVMERDLV